MTLLNLSGQPGRPMKKPLMSLRSAWPMPVNGALVCMKHVGLNVAADAFINSAITGVNGGLVVAVADDPSMHSSQNEQDSRVYGKFAMVPVLEPASQQDLYDAVRYAFDLSESVKLPVLLRLTTRLAHSRAGVERATNTSAEPAARRLRSGTVCADAA